MDFNDEHILDNYLTASLIQPILKARPYYAFQLLYISEFTLMPIMFILFFVCSMKRTRPTRSESDSDYFPEPKSFSDVNALSHVDFCAAIQNFKNGFNLNFVNLSYRQIYYRLLFLYS